MGSERIVPLHSHRMLDTHMHVHALPPYVPAGSSDAFGHVQKVYSIEEWAFTPTEDNRNHVPEGHR